MRSKEHWIKELGEDWTMSLRGTLKSPYMDKLMNFVAIEYSLNSLYPFSSRNVFEPLKDCPLSKVEVVIVVKEPEINVSRLSSLYGGDSLDPQYNIAYQHIRRRVETDFYDGFILDFDYSLQHWVDQGVLILPLSLTTRKHQSGSHLIQWNKFVQSTIATICLHKPDTIFCLWGKEAQNLAPLLKHQHVLYADDPGLLVDQRFEWQCDNFKRINTIREQLYGKGFAIQW